MNVVDFYHALHVRAAQATTDLDHLDVRASLALQDVAKIARHDPTGAGHLARAVDGVLHARRRELVGMRVDQSIATGALIAAGRRAVTR